MFREMIRAFFSHSTRKNRAIIYYLQIQQHSFSNIQFYIDLYWLQLLGGRLTNAFFDNIFNTINIWISNKT